MISLWGEQAGPWWFAVAHHEQRLVATALGSSRDDASRSIRQCIPAGRESRFEEQVDAFASGVVRMLARLEAGEEDGPSFELCPDCVSRPLAAVLHAASAIPRGYVSSYGSVAEAAGTEARVVGRAMATNPLYPIVACHRVVGSDLSLVGYTGRQDSLALKAKLDRLRAEARGFGQEKVLETRGGLRLFPVEWVIRKASRDGVGDGTGQLTLW